jgi:hypothetical protein
MRVYDWGYDEGRVGDEVEEERECCGVLWSAVEYTIKSGGVDREVAAECDEKCAQSNERRAGEDEECALGEQGGAVDRRVVLWIEGWCCGSKGGAVDRRVVLWIEGVDRPHL